MICRHALSWLVFCGMLGFASVIAAEKELAPSVRVAQQARRLAAQGDTGAAIQKAQQALTLAKQSFGAKHEYVAYILDDLATFEYQQGRIQKALLHAQQATTLIAERRGRASTEYASLANNLATLWMAQGRFKQAIDTYHQVQTIFLQQLGLKHTRTAQVLRNLGIAYTELSDFPQAQTFFQKALQANQLLFGETNVKVARAKLDLAGSLLRQENIAPARQLAEQVSQQKGETLADAAVMLARIDIQQSALNQAETRLQTVLEQLDSTQKPNSKTTKTRSAALYHLGFIYILRGQSVEAEPVFKQVLLLYRKSLGENHPAVARTLHSLAIIYQNLQQYPESERFYQKAIDTFAGNFGAINASVAATRLEFGMLLSETGKTDAAIQQAEQALSIYKQLPGDWKLKQAYATSSLGFALHRSKQLEKAATAFEQATTLMTQVRGEQSSDLPPGLTQLGDIYRKLDRLADAEGVLNRAIAIREKDRAVTPAGLAQSLSVLAQLRLQQGQQGAALTLSRRAIGLIEERLDITQSARSAAALGEQSSARYLFEQYLDIARNNQDQPLKATHSLLPEMFKVAQLPHLTGTAASITRMAGRFASEKGPLSDLIRTRQDALENWRALDQTLTEQLTNPTNSRQNNVLRKKLVAVSRQIDRLDQTLRKQFPAYTELTNPRPVTIATVQQWLKPNEALFLQVSSDTGTSLFLIRKNGASTKHTPLNKTTLASQVSSIRAGLDLREENPDLLEKKLLAFDSQAAYSLYQQLLLPFEQDLQSIKHIITVLDGAIQNLPLSLLLTKPVKTQPRRVADYKTLDFLGRHYAFSVMPSVSSFKVLRSTIQQSSASMPFIGFGDPEFNGNADTTRSIASINNQLVTGIDPDFLRSSFLPLPETKDELKTLARTLKALPDALFLRHQATESMVKEHDLSRYHVIAFATHGLLAGEFRGLAEPALVLTPPAKATPLDNGLLTASEIAMLKLDADWVILSACNTANPSGRPGAEGLSGLAKAFFYAGSRALLVSHWWVASESSVSLTTGALQALADNPEIGRAEALRQSMLKLMNGKVDPYFAHPVFWAPFVTVGEGG